MIYDKVSKWNMKNGKVNLEYLCKETKLECQSINIHPRGKQL